MQEDDPAYRFLVMSTDEGWMVLGSGEPLGPFHARSQAEELAHGMATAIRRLGDTVTVRVTGR